MSQRVKAREATVADLDRFSLLHGGGGISQKALYRPMGHRLDPQLVVATAAPAHASGDAAAAPASLAPALLAHADAPRGRRSVDDAGVGAGAAGAGAGGSPTKGKSPASSWIS